MCTEFKLAVWGFQGGRNTTPVPLFLVHRPLDELVVLGNFIYTFFESGESCYFALCGEELRRIEFERSAEHEDRIVSVDTHVEKGLIVTGDSDGLIKVWNARKELIREIKFNEAITTVSFMNTEADLLVGHGGQLSKIALQDYCPGKQMTCTAQER